MSRIGLKPIELPAGVEVKVDGNNVVTVKGPKGELTEQLSNLVNVTVDGAVVTVSRDSDAKAHRTARISKNSDQQHGCWCNTGL
jgi:large subunit ribosomal protein L6